MFQQSCKVMTKLRCSFLEVLLVSLYYCQYSVESFQPNNNLHLSFPSSQTRNVVKRSSETFTDSKSNLRLLSPRQDRRCTKITRYGIDFDAIMDDECDFTDGDLSHIDFSRCMPTPSADIESEEVVTLCMEALANNNNPKENAGLEVCYDFSSDRCRAANGETLEAFIHFAGNPIFRLMVDALEWKTLSVGPEISPGPTRGAMKTVLISVRPRNTNLKERNFLWTLQKERRPPRQGFWLVHECIIVDNAFSKTI